MTDTRIPLSRDRILTAAVELADAAGVEVMSMRKLAGSLGFEVMSLYNHIANKGDLITGMVDWIAGDMARLDPDRPGKQAVRDMSISAHDVLIEHPWAAPLWTRSMPGPNRLLLMEDLLAAFRRGGFSPRLAHFGFHAITMHIVGFTLQQLNYAETNSATDDAASAFIATLDPEQFPYMIEHVEYHIHDDEGGDFVFILDLILDGLERAKG
ncbi:MAG: TetR/AcrR family transcriptional regulator C-terminal domain-containing protein [Acidimicrobiia bacterium]|nr:TetR/AcrR family transcriptional regulator C-terminal domain-containing protein [Acidimicrobiia bacterium]